MKKILALVLLAILAGCSGTLHATTITRLSDSALAGTSWRGTGTDVDENGNEVRVTQTLHLFANGSGELTTTPRVLLTPTTAHFTWSVRSGRLYVRNGAAVSTLHLDGGELVNDSSLVTVQRFRQA